jgi:hypothetical protein
MMDKSKSNKSHITTEDINEMEEFAEYEQTKQDNVDLENNTFLNENAATIQKLNFSNNSFTEVTSYFLRFENLILLDMSNNKIKNIDNLKFLLKVEVLLFANNEVRNISSVTYGLKNLRHVDFSNNKLICNDSLLKCFKFNKNLISLVIKGNVNYDFDTMKFKCLEMLLSLEYLDNVQIYLKKIIKKHSINIDVNTKSGAKKQVKTLVEYIKLRKEEMKENPNLFEKSQIDSSKLTSGVGVNKYAFSSAYYYLNKLDL